jgi:hypothetical protein
VKGGGFEITGGADYAVGDQFKIGEDVDGWTTPALVEVSAVGEGGSITEVTLVEGGAFTGGAGLGTYNLDGNSADLLLMARSHPTTAQNTHQQAQARERSTGLVFATCITAFLAVFAMFVVRRRSAAVLGRDTAAIQRMEAASTTPTACGPATTTTLVA